MVHEYHVIYSVRHYLQFHVTVVGIRMYCLWMLWHYYTYLPKIAGLLPAEAVGFFWAKKSSVCLPSEGK
jgi:hypothetical protein